MELLKRVQVEKQNEVENFKKTIHAVKRLYESKGGPEDGKY